MRTHTTAVSARQLYKLAQDVSISMLFLLNQEVIYTSYCVKL